MSYGYHFVFIVEIGETNYKAKEENCKEDWYIED